MKILYVITVTILLTVSSGNLVSAGTNELEYSQNIVEFQLLTAPPEPIRQPAEFEPMEGVLIRYPFGMSK